jgi:hypothetical protein
MGQSSPQILIPIYASAQNQRMRGIRMRPVVDRVLHHAKP